MANSTSERPFDCTLDPTMTVMSDAALKEALDRGAILIEPAPEQIKAASIDFRLGPEAFLGTQDQITSLEDKRLLVIPPGELALVTTLEKIRLGPQFAGQIGLRSHFARKGLALLAGPQVDPGFHGRLHVALVNLSPIEISIAYREPLVTIVFHDLGSAVERPYGSDASDEYAEQDEITGGEIDDIRQHRGYAMSEVIREMANLSTNVAELRTSVGGYIQTADRMMRRTENYLGIAVAAVAALAACLIGVLIANAL